MESKTLDYLFKIAADLEPDYINWSYGEHSWCFDFVEAGEAYLKAKGIQTRPSYINSNLFKPTMTHHVWIELKDGLIVDPTIKQFFLSDKNYCHCHESCQHCKPKLLKSDFLNSSFWLVDIDDKRRSFYLYADQNGNAISSADKVNSNPALK